MDKVRQLKNMSMVKEAHYVAAKSQTRCWQTEIPGKELVTVDIRKSGIGVKMVGSDNWTS